jgi:hypothetical protein
LLGELATAARTTPGAGREGLHLVRRDSQTGEDYLRIPLPTSDVLDQALGAIKTLLDQFRKP